MVRAVPRPDHDRERTVGIALVVAAACLYGSGPLFARVAYDAGMSPLPLLTWRYVFAALVGWLLVAATRSGRRSLLAITRRDLAVLLVLGLLFVVNAGSYTAALETVPAGLVAIIVYLYPALVAVMSIRYARRLEGRRPWIALAVSTSGVGLAVGGIPDDAEIPLLGLLLALSSAVFYAIWIVVAARMRGERPAGEPAAPVREAAATTAPVERVTATGPEDIGASATGPDALASSAIMSTVTALTAAVLTVLVGGDAAPGVVPSEAWPALLGFGAFSAFAVVTFLGGTRRIGAARAALVSTVEPVYTIVLATILLGETLRPIQVLGGTLVVVGVLLAESGRARRPEGDGLATEVPGGTDADRATV